MNSFRIRPTNLPIVIVGVILITGLVAGTAVAQREQSISEQTTQKRHQTESLLDTIPAPSDAQKISYQATAIAGKQQFTGEWTSSASLINLANYYYRTLEKNGWETSSNPITNQNQQLGQIAATKDDRSAYISLERNLDTNQTAISVVIPSTTNQVPLSKNQLLAQEADLGNNNSQTTKVAFVANTGIGSNFTHLLNLIESEQADFVVHVGDFDLQHNPEFFSSVISSVLGEDYPYLYVPGDQDYATELWYGDCSTNCYSNELLRRAEQNQLEITFPEVQQESSFDTYAVNLGSVHIVALGLGDLDTSSTGVGNTVYTPFINQTFNDSDAQIKVCVVHETMYQIQLGNQVDSIGWQPLEACRQQGAMIVTGADASYYRSKTILNYPEQIISQIWNESDMVRLEPGTSFLVNAGLGGALLDLQQRCKPITPPYGCQEEWASIYSLNQQAQPGVLFLEVDTNQPTLASGYFKNSNNQLIDSFGLSVWKPGTQLTEANTKKPTNILSATDNNCQVILARSAATKHVSSLICR